MTNPIEPVQKLVAVKPDSNMIGLVEESVLPNISQHLAPDKIGLEGVLLAVAAHKIIHKDGKIIPDKIGISGEQDYGMFVYIELTYRDSPPADEIPGEKNILFNRCYRYLIDAYSQTAMLIGTTFK